MTKVYLAGPISSRPYKEAKFDFNTAQYVLEERGLEVVNPMNLTNEDMAYADCMRTVVPRLLGCDGIVLLPGWEKSTGAQVERALASLCGITIGTFEEWTEVDGF